MHYKTYSFCLCLFLFAAPVCAKTLDAFFTPFQYSNIFGLHWLLPIRDTSVKKIYLQMMDVRENRSDTALKAIIVYSKGLPSSIIYLKEDGKRMATKHELRYYGDTLLSTITDYNFLGNVKILHEYSYDSLLRLNAIIDYTKDSNIYHATFFNYDDNNLIYKVEYEGTGLKKYTEQLIYYDKEKRIVKTEEFRSDSSLYCTTKFDYNKNHVTVIKKKEEFISEKSIYTLDYEYHVVRKEVEKPKWLSDVPDRKVYLQSYYKNGMIKDLIETADDKILHITHYYINKMP